MKNIYFNYFILAPLGGLLLGYLLIGFVFQPIFKSNSLAVVGAFFFVGIVILYMTKFIPLFMIIYNKKAKFYGVPWRFEIKREWLDGIIIGIAGFYFKPKLEYENKFKNLPWFSDEKYIEIFGNLPDFSNSTFKGFKTFTFVNYKALNEFIEIMRPITGDVLKEETLISKNRKEKLYRKMYGD